MPAPEEHETVEWCSFDQALRLKGSPLAPDGSLSYMDQGYQRLPLVESASGVDEKGNATAAKKFDFDAIRALEVPSDSDPLRAAAAGLRAAGLDPAGAKQSVDHSIFQAVDATGRSVVNKAIDTQVDYSFSLQAAPSSAPALAPR